MVLPINCGAVGDGVTDCTVSVAAAGGPNTTNIPIAGTKLLLGIYTAGRESKGWNSTQFSCVQVVH